MDVQADLSLCLPHLSYCRFCCALVHLKVIPSMFSIKFQIIACPKTKGKTQGPVVQSIVSLTISLRVISLTVLADSIYNILIFFAEKCEYILQCKSYSHFFSKKFQNMCVSLDVNFKESLTKDIVSFEQLGPVLHLVLAVFQPHLYKMSLTVYVNIKGPGHSAYLHRLIRTSFLTSIKASTKMI